MPTLEAIINHFMYRRASGKAVHLSPDTAAEIERILRKALEPPYISPGKLNYRIDEWSSGFNKITKTLAYCDDFEVAKAAWAKVKEMNPSEYLTFRQGASVFGEQVPASQSADAT